MMKIDSTTKVATTKYLATRFNPYLYHFVKPEECLPDNMLYCDSLWPEGLNEIEALNIRN